MPRRVQLSESDIQWLRANHRNFTHVELARRISCNVDTLKRILVRLELQYFPGAKYQTATSNSIQKWNRPCLDCGCTKTRPRHHYYCRRCRNLRGFSNDD